jgi:hypothetical protein
MWRIIAIVLAVGLEACLGSRPPVVVPPAPEPTPSPVATPNPPAGDGPTCPVAVDADHYVDLHVGSIGPSVIHFTATAAYCGFPLRSDIFANCRTKCCVLGVDGARRPAVPDDPAITCERLLSGPPSWRGSPGLVLTPAFDGNPYNVSVSGVGTLQACGLSSCSNVVEIK